MPSSRVSDEQAQQQKDRQDQEHERRDQEHEPGGGTAEEHAAELARAEDRYKRALADLDNYRKRSAREVDRRLTEATDALVVQWLEVVDSIERALAMVERDSPMYPGLRGVLDQIEAVLARQGVHRIATPGERFDPERHEAVSIREDPEAEDRSVLDVARSGYERGGRVLRPAEVVVARRPEAAT
jgi:molecular chaperone GrpE